MVPPIWTPKETGLRPLAFFALVNWFQDLFERKGMRRPNHCIGGEIRATYLIPLFWIMQAERSQIKLISPIQKRSDIIADANRRPAQFSSVFSLIFRYVKNGREKAQESPHCRSKLELESRRFGLPLGESACRNSLPLVYSESRLSNGRSR